MEVVLPRPAKPKYMKWRAKKIDKVDEVKLFNMVNDKEEKYNLAAQYPDKVSELMSAIEQARLELGDKDMIGSGARFFDDTSKTERISEYEKWSETIK